MKKTILLIALAFLGVSPSLRAQDALTENLNFKIGVLGIWLAYEKPLGGPFLLDAEFGYLGGILNSEFIFTSTFELEPRYYYNLDKRMRKNKGTKNNSANYIALQLSYIPNFLTATTKNNSNISVVRTFSAIPTYGLRRNISGGLNFDFEIGVGYLWAKDFDNELTANLLIGLSYAF